jgi:hypothetical protein
MKRLQYFGATLLLLTSFVSENVVAEIYTWTDESGKVHFSDKPRENENVTTLELTENNNIADTVIKNSQWQQDYNKSQEAKVAQAQKEAKKAKKNKGYCSRLKSELAIYNQGGRLYLMSDDGQRSYQSEEQLKSQKKKFTQLIKKNCS